MRVNGNKANIYRHKNSLYIRTYIYLYKGKAVPLQAWTGPEGS